MGTLENPEGPLNTLTYSIAQWAISKGFWEQWEDAEWLESFAEQYSGARDSDPATVARLRRMAVHHKKMFIQTKLMLMVSEVVEAHNAERDDEGFAGPHFAEELVDIIIRVLDTAGYLQLDMDGVIERKMAVNQNRPYRHGRQF